MTCIVCGGWAQQAHHVIYRQELRRIASGPTHTFSRLLGDERNLIPVCVTCHGRHHGRQAPMPMALLPDCVVDFAAEVMGANRAYGYLNRHYACPSEGDPRLERMLDALPEVEGESLTVNLRMREGEGTA